MAETMLKVDNINVYYGNIHAVKDVSFDVNEGEIVFRVVDLPAPLAPIRVTISPSFTSNETSLTAWMLP